MPAESVPCDQDNNSGPPSLFSCPLWSTTASQLVLTEWFFCLSCIHCSCPSGFHRPHAGVCEMSHGPSPGGGLPHPPHTWLLPPTVGSAQGWPSLRPHCSCHLQGYSGSSARGSLYRAALDGGEQPPSTSPLGPWVPVPPLCPPAKPLLGGFCASGRHAGWAAETAFLLLCFCLFSGRTCIWVPELN